jgi:type IV pilus assembly protein PilC
MKYEELAFVNQQLAGMLKTGIPLEAGLRQLCQTMRAGGLRDELRALESDLARGTPLKDALAERALPEFYVKMVQLGSQTNDLPAVLTLVADYYQRAQLVWTRLKGLLVYPLIVLVTALGLSVFVAVACSALLAGHGNLYESSWYAQPGSSGQVSQLVFRMWTPALGLMVVSIAAAIVVLVPAWRRQLRWRLPGFREGSLTNVASTLSLMLSNGSHLAEALELARRLEAGSPAGEELQRWKDQLAAGCGKIIDISRGSKLFPPLFIWLVAQGGEDLAAGFKKAAEIYHARALYRVEMFLYAALPVSVLVLGVMILGQSLPLFGILALQMDALGSATGP